MPNHYCSLQDRWKKFIYFFLRISSKEILLSTLKLTLAISKVSNQEEMISLLNWFCVAANLVDFLKLQRRWRVATHRLLSVQNRGPQRPHSCCPGSTHSKHGQIIAPSHPRVIRCCWNSWNQLWFGACYSKCSPKTVTSTLLGGLVRIFWIRFFEQDP